jgi:hypothetical protein
MLRQMNLGTEKSPAGAGLLTPLLPLKKNLGVGRSYDVRFHFYFALQDLGHHAVMFGAVDGFLD